MYGYGVRVRPLRARVDAYDDAVLYDAGGPGRRAPVVVCSLEVQRPVGLGQDFRKFEEKSKWRAV